MFFVFRSNIYNKKTMQKASKFNECIHEIVRLIKKTQKTHYGCMNSLLIKICNACLFFKYKHINNIHLQ